MNTEQLYIDLIRQIEEAETIPPCRDSDPEQWFNDRGEVYDARIAKNLCESCPVINACATYAIAAPEHFGIWGGLSPMDRAKIRNSARRRGSLAR